MKEAEARERGLLEALQEIAERPQGVFSRDSEQYLKNVIEWCRERALVAIAQAQEAGAGKGGEDDACRFLPPM